LGLSREEEKGIYRKARGQTLTRFCGIYSLTIIKSAVAYIKIPATKLAAAAAVKWCIDEVQVNARWAFKTGFSINSAVNLVSAFLFLRQGGRTDC